MKTALIAGATGAASTRLVETLLEDPACRVVGLSRRGAKSAHERLSYQRCDLLDPASCASALAAAGGVTHVYYAARAAFGEGGVEDVAQNVAMLRNVLDAVEAASPDLRHVHLVEGQKWYDVRLNFPRIPTREDDPRHMPPNFYYDQEDLLRERQAGRSWSWSASRPHMIYDFAPERARNVVPTIGAWAALCAEHRLPLDFPGSPRCFTSLMEFTDAGQFAHALAWMADSPNARNQAFNVSDACQFRWIDLWPRIALHFGLPLGTVRQTRLADTMKDKDAAWQRVAARHGLQPRPLREVVSWEFADFLWSREEHNITSTTKIRLAGFHGVVDTGDRFLAHLQRYRDARLLP